MKKNEVPIWEKMNLTVEEAAAYSNIGAHKIRELLREDDCDFALSIGLKKTLIKRKEFEEYIRSRLAI